MRIVILLSLLLAIPVLGFSTTIHVPTDYLTIQEAIDAAMNGDTVLVDPGTYVENIDFVGKAITVKSLDGPGATIIDGQAQAMSVVRFMNGEGPDSVLEGFTLTNGAGTYYPSWLGKCGGGVYCNQTSPTLMNNIITGNWAAYGGGIACFGTSTPAIHYHTIAGNSVTKSGEALCFQYSNAVIKHSIIWGTMIGYHPSITYSCVMGGWPGTGNIDQDPLFVDAAGHDFRLMQHPCQAGVVNPCVDAGDPAAPLPKGTTRTDFFLDQGVVDMGCHYLAIIVPDDYPTIQAAIDALSSSGGINVRAGTYMENINFKGKPISLVSLDGPEVTVIDGNQMGPVATLENISLDPGACINGFTLRNGLSMSGGGIYCFMTNLTLQNNVITANTASGGHGGGVYCEGGSLTMGENDIHANTCSLNGGGLFCIGDSPSIQDTTVCDNVAGWSGGGIYTDGECLTFQNNHLSGNTAGVNGGGLACLHADSSTLKDNQLSGNTASASGGGIYCEGAYPALLQNTVHDNVAGGSGGGIYTDGECLTFQNNHLSGNTAGVNGGGLACLHADSSTLEDNQLSGNTASASGGGIYCEGAYPALAHNTLRNNAAGTSGGGMACFQASPCLDTNTFFNNQAASGGGMSFQQSYPTLVNSTFFGNHAASGGGIASDDLSGPILTNNTLYMNSASASGGGMDGASGNPAVTNCIFWHNDAPVGPQIHGANTLVSCSDVEGGWPGTGNLDADPRFKDPSIPDFHLTVDSPCMDKGDCYAPGIPDLDYEGDPRIFYGIVDMGVDEYTLGGNMVIHVPAECPTIQQAIGMACNTDTVLVAPGTYVENISFNGKAITVKSSAGAEKTVIDGRQAGSVVAFCGGEGPDSILDGFTLTNGIGTDMGGMWPHYYGGGINCLFSSPTITNNTISRNLVIFGDGGGIGCRYGSPTITNNTISGNFCDGLGPGIYCEGGSPTITNSTISGNGDYWSGGCGGIVCDSNTTITNTILWGNIGDQIEGDPQVTYSDVQGGYPGLGNIDSDPLFVDPGYLDDNGTPGDLWDDFWVDGDYHLTFNSPCRGSGKNGAVTGLTDFEGDPRIAYGTVDMGADEFHTHLYFTGNATPGGNVEVKLVGLPGTHPVFLCVGSGVLDAPIPTQYGDWRLDFPLLLILGMGSMASPEGVSVLPFTFDPGFPAVDIPIQSLIGMELTNLCVMPVK